MCYHCSTMGEEEPTCTTCTNLKDRAAFDGWKSGAAFKEAYGQKKKEGDADKKPKQPLAPLWTKPPVPVFYEGTLVISAANGA